MNSEVVLNSSKLMPGSGKQQMYKKHVTTLLSMFGVMALALLGIANAQQAKPLILTTALQQAYAQGPSVQSAQATLQNAQLTLNARKADPSTLILDLTKAQQTADLAKLNLAATRLQVMQSVVGDFFDLYAAQQNVALYQAQVQLDQRNLEIAKAKAVSGNGTALDVARAQTTLDMATQSLTNAQASAQVASSKLATVMGVTGLGPVTIANPPEAPQLTVSLSDLSKNLLGRLPAVVQAQQAVDYDQLEVKLYNNDYTPALTLETAKTSLENDQRALQIAQQNAQTSLSNDHDTVASLYKGIAISKQGVASANKVVTQDQVALKAGTISSLTLETDQVSLKSAQYSLVQAQGSYWTALASLSVDSGQDLTGLVTAAPDGH